MTNAIAWDTFTKFCNEFVEIIDSVATDSIESGYAINGVDTAFDEVPKLLSILGINLVERPEQINYDALHEWNSNR